MLYTQVFRTAMSTAVRELEAPNSLATVGSASVQPVGQSGEDRNSEMSCKEWIFKTDGGVGVGPWLGESQIQRAGWRKSLGHEPSRVKFLLWGSVSSALKAFQQIGSGQGDPG